MQNLRATGQPLLNSLRDLAPIIWVFPKSYGKNSKLPLRGFALDRRNACPILGSQEWMGLSGRRLPDIRSLCELQVVWLFQSAPSPFMPIIFRCAFCPSRMAGH